MTLNLYHQTSFSLSPDYIADEAQQLRQQSPELASWAMGGGVIVHQPATQIQAHLMAESLLQKGLIPDTRYFFQRLQDLDCLTQQAMWLVVHWLMRKSTNRWLVCGESSPPSSVRQGPVFR